MFHSITGAITGAITAVAAAACAAVAVARAPASTARRSGLVIVILCPSLPVTAKRYHAPSQSGYCPLFTRLRIWATPSADTGPAPLPQLLRI